MSTPRPAVAWWKRLGIVGGRTALALVLLVAAVLALQRADIGFDVSADRRFSVDPALRRIVAQVAAPTELVAVWDRGQEAALGLEAIRIGLGSVAAAGSRLSLRTIDSEIQRPELEALRRRIGDAGGPAVYVVRGDSAVRIPMHAGSRAQLQRELGAALLRLADSKPTAAVVLQGHGELRPGGGPGDGADALLRTLRLAGFAVRLRDAADAQAVPPDAVVVVPGPTANLGAAGLRMLGDHLRDGGGMLLFADDRIPDDLARWLRGRGLLIGPAMPGEDQTMADLPRGDRPATTAQIVVSLRRHAVGQEAGLPHHNLILAGEGQVNLAAEPAVAVSGGVQLLAPWSTPVQAIPVSNLPDLAAAYRANGVHGLSAEPLLQTAVGDAWTMRRGDPLDPPPTLGEAGAISLAWLAGYAPDPASVRAGLGGRLAIWGSRQAACDGVLETGTWANDRLIAGLAAWAARRQPPAEIPAAEVKAYQLHTGDRGLQIITALVIAIIPMSLLGVAMLRWWDRR